MCDLFLQEKKYTCNISNVSSCWLHGKLELQLFDSSFIMSLPDKVTLSICGQNNRLLQYLVTLHITVEVTLCNALATPTQKSAFDPPSLTTLYSSQLPPTSLLIHLFSDILFFCPLVFSHLSISYILTRTHYVLILKSMPPLCVKYNIRII